MWSEVITGEYGAVNFMTGSGGFLQALLNGYAGIRIFLDRLEINSPRLPANTEFLSIYGKHTHIVFYVINKVYIAIISYSYNYKYTLLSLYITLHYIILTEKFNAFMYIYIFTGVKYLDATFDIEIGRDTVNLTFTKIDTDRAFIIKPLSITVELNKICKNIISK